MLFSKWFFRSISGWLRAVMLAVLLLGMLMLPASKIQAGTPNLTGTPIGTAWSQMTPNAGWSARFNHTSVALPDGSIVLMGGNDGSRKNDVWRSTDGGKNWNQLASPGWTARVGHTSVALPDGTIVLLGGYDGDCKNDVWRFGDFHHYLPLILR